MEKIICTNCKKEFERFKSIIEKNKRKKKKNEEMELFCSMNCKNQYRGINIFIDTINVSYNMEKV